MNRPICPYCNQHIEPFQLQVGDRSDDKSRPHHFECAIECYGQCNVCQTPLFDDQETVHNYHHGTIHEACQESLDALDDTDRDYYTDPMTGRLRP